MSGVVVDLLRTYSSTYLRRYMYMYLVGRYVEEYLHIPVHVVLSTTCTLQLDFYRVDGPRQTTSPAVIRVSPFSFVVRLARRSGGKAG